MGTPAGSPAALDGIAFVAQDMPLYRHLSVADMLHLTRNLNLHFDTAYARRRVTELGISSEQKAGKLSGGQRAQLALTLALARHPRLLVLDEPTAPLDPLARHDFMAAVMTAMADDGVSVVLSSHMLAELERVADYLVLISHGRVRVDDTVEDLLAEHRLLTAPAADAAARRLGGHRVQHDRRADPPVGPVGVAGTRRCRRAASRGPSASRNSRWPTSARPPRRRAPALMGVTR